MLKNIMRWVRRLVRKIVYGTPSRSIVCRTIFSGKEVVRSYRVARAVGMHLVGVDEQDASSTRMISSGGAIDPKQFWLLWLELSHDEYFLSDGTRYEPWRDYVW